MKTIKPFAVGSLLVVIISLFPPLMNVMAAIPAPVGYAVTFVIFTKMVGMALREIEQSANRERTYNTAGLALLVGVGAMFLPPEATLQLPTVIASLLNNGLVLGTVIAIITEQYLIRKEARR
jgi:xanthine/uracil permease